jgi:hypothetical protein
MILASSASDKLTVNFPCGSSGLSNNLPVPAAKSSSSSFF